MYIHISDLTSSHSPDVHRSGCQKVKRKFNTLLWQQYTVYLYIFWFHLLFERTSYSTSLGDPFCCDPVSFSPILAAPPPRKTKFIDKSLTMLLHLFFFLLLSLPPPYATAASSAFPLSIYRLASNSPFPLM